MNSTRVSAKKIEDFLDALGFDETAIRAYLALLWEGPQAILQLSRNSGIERTKLYRKIDSLVEMGLVEEVLAHKRRMFKAADPSGLQVLIESRKNKLKSLEESLPMFSDEYFKLVSESPGARVVYYRGKDGLRQILWNELQMKGEAVGYLYRVLQEPLGVKFFMRWAEEFERKKLRFRDIRSDEFMKSMKLPQYPRRHIKGSIWRYIPDSVLRLTHNMDVYDDVTAIYYWQGEELFGLEIYNQQIADMQRSMFEVFWKIAAKYKTKRKKLRDKLYKRKG